MPLVHLKTRNIEYKFQITDKYSIIKGDSGSGKTTLYNLAVSLTAGNVVQNGSDAVVAAVPVDFDSFNLGRYEGAVLIIDEDNTLFKKPDVASILESSHNYFILIIRKLKLGYLPINTESVFKIVESGKFHTLRKFYDEDTIIK